MSIPKSCDDDDGNDQHDGREDENDAEDGHQPSEPVHLLLNHVVQFCSGLNPGRGRSRGLLFMRTHCNNSDEREEKCWDSSEGSRCR